MNRAALLLAALLVAAPFGSAQEPPRIGVVVMHGKGGLPDGAVHELAIHLAEKHLVANLEMPWSSRRDYDVDVPAAVAQIEAALADLRAKGAAKVFVAGHSQGGVFALYVAGKVPIDGVVAIAPGGDAANPAMQERVAASRSRAAALVADGKGTERTHFVDGARAASRP
jgi:triacylglycerol esterase/lipase EstA (alpha/beta hydrolase family)